MNGDAGGPAVPGHPAPFVVEALDATVMSRCWDLARSAQQAGGWHPPTVFALAELCARFGFGFAHRSDGLTTGEAEAYSCVLGEVGAPILWQCRDAGPMSASWARAGGGASVLLGRVVVAEAVFPSGVAQHRWLLRADCEVVDAQRGGPWTLSAADWVVSRTRMRWLGFAHVSVGQRWRPLPGSTGTASPVDLFGVATALCFADRGVSVLFGSRSATLLSELVDVPFVSRFGPTAASEGL